MDKKDIILECDFAFKCPTQWENLEILDDPSKRFCKTCQREVFFITNRAELESSRKLGRCIAANVYEIERNEDIEELKSLIVTGGINPTPYGDVLVLGPKKESYQLIRALEKAQKAREQKQSNKK